MAERDRRMLRFGAGPPPRPYSSVWLLWRQKRSDDLFLASRDVAGMFKMSMHQSGVWTAAWTTQSDIRVEGSGNRRVDQWSRSPEFAPGWTQGITVNIPYVSVTLPAVASPAESSVRWIRPPVSGQQLHFIVLIGPGQIARWAAMVRPNDELVGTVPLLSGGLAGVVASWLPATDEQQRKSEELQRDIRIGGITPDNFTGGSLIGLAPDRIIGAWELPLGLENLQVTDTVGVRE